MPKEYKHDGETFLLDDSKGCYIEVTYAETGKIAGVVGVRLNGTERNPYHWACQRPDGSWIHGQVKITPDGIGGGGGSTANVESGLQQLCQQYLKELREIRDLEAFKHDEACQGLHDFVNRLTD